MDHLWHNLSIDNTNFVIGPNLSDHYAISSLFDKNIDLKPKSFQFIDFSLVIRQRFSSNIDTEFSAFNPPTHNADVYTEYLERFLFEMLKKYFPLKRKTITSKRLRAPWLCNDIMVCIHKKHKWHKMAKQGLISFCSYKKYCTLLRKLLTLAEKDYFLKKLNSLGTDPKKNWAVLNKLLNKNLKNISDHFTINNTSVFNPDVISNEFNNYFVNHPSSINESIAESSRDFSYLIENSVHCMHFSYSTPDEITRVISLMKKNGSTHDLSRNFLKICCVHISFHLSNIFNLCIDTAKFPESLKMAKVTPVFKKGSHIEIKNHRPISILCNFSKIFDSLIHSRLSSYFTNDNFLSRRRAAPCAAIHGVASTAHIAYQSSYK